jgi:molybdenum cofactor cytidylyltransferase
MKVGIVILAAGASTRMGAPKQILPVFGTTMIKHLVNETFETKCDPITIVVGANKDKVVPELKNMPIAIIDNPAWATGMGSSIKMGLVGTYMVAKDIDALIFMTTDMPYVNTDLLDKLVKKAIANPNKNMVACKYSNTLGIPVLFKKPRFEDILDLKPAEGAKYLLKKYRDEVVYVDFELGKIDLDTKEQYFEFIQSKN